MQLVPKKQADQEFSEQKIREVTIVRSADKQWYFTYGVQDGRAWETHALGMDRDPQMMRKWKEPRTLIDFLHRSYGVTEGRFVLEE